MHLPIDPFVPAVSDALRAHRAAVVVAAPGAGKTTRVPPALARDGRIILLQPRRVAARSIARRIAQEQGWRLGEEIGWHVRLEKRFIANTQLIVATEGILTARLQQDPLLSGFTTVVLDEFHERSIHADLGIALVKQAWLARDDLRIVVMSATIDAAPVSAYLGGCPVIDVPGRSYPLDIRYRPGATVASAVGEVLSATAGSVLCFMPGAREVHRAADEVRREVKGPEVIELHGSMTADDQDRALRESGSRRVVVATNVAETSLTIPGVSGVVDSGFHKVARYDAARGLDSLELERISLDSAGQRAGRAGRDGPGVVCRLWSEADRLEPHREPDIHRMDLAGPVLDIFAWGGDPASFDWFEPPPPASLAHAIDLLIALGAVQDGRLTPEGREMSRLSVHPRLAKILISARGSYEAALACAVLSERLLLPPHPPSTANDLAGLIERESSLPRHVLDHARQLHRSSSSKASVTDVELRRAVLAGYPDRVGKRRGPGDPRVLMSAGYGAVLGAESGVRDGELIVAVDIQAGRRGELSEARIRIASVADREWLSADRRETRCTLSDDGVVRATEREMFGALMLRERPVAVDPTQAAEMLANAWLDRPRSDDDRELLARLRFAGMTIDVRDLALRAAAGHTALREMDLANGLEWTERRQLDSLAPPVITVPSGRTHRLQYRDDGTVVLSVKLQELFGLAETPLVGPSRVPLLIELLAPNGRAVQTTRDLRSFWTTTYADVRRELRGRYPKHPWPEDPWNATPTARTTKGARG